jgi:hypothetical protein
MLVRRGGSLRLATPAAADDGVPGIGRMLVRGDSIDALPGIDQRPGAGCLEAGSRSV